MNAGLQQVLEHLKNLGIKARLKAKVLRPKLNPFRFKLPHALDTLVKTLETGLIGDEWVAAK
jgi:hypothetical protein